MAPFLDSNIVIYAFTADWRSVQSQVIINSPFIISSQVLNQFANVARSKQGFGWLEISESMTILIQRAELLVSLTPALSLDAARIAGRYKTHIYDALIIAAALHAGCDTLYSEDMQHGLVIEKRLTICNPFVSPI